MTSDCPACTRVGAVDVADTDREVDMVEDMSALAVLFAPCAPALRLLLAGCRWVDWACKHSWAEAAPLEALGSSSFDGCVVAQDVLHCATMGGTCLVAEEMDRA